MDQYEALFGGLNVSLPALTSTVLGFSRAAAENVPAFFAIIGILLAGDGLGYYLLRRYAERPWGRLWWWGVLAVEALVLAGVFRTIILPARRIAESLSG